MTVEGHTHGQKPGMLGPKHVTRVDMTLPMLVMLMILIVTIAWGWSNQARIEEVLERLDAVEEKLDRVIPEKK